MSDLGTVARRFAHARSGVSAIEFAIGAPAFIALLLFGVDTTRFIQATRQVEEVAVTIGQMLSVNTQGSVTYQDLQFYHDSAMVIFPQVLADAAQQNIAWSSDIGISMASIKFNSAPNCGTSCVYLPQVLWTGGSNPRSCLVPPTAAADSAPPSSTTLPSDAFGPNAIVVVDTSFKFRPTIAPSFMKSLTISRSYYVTPRFVSSITYSKIAGDNGIAKSC